MLLKKFLFLFLIKKYYCKHVVNGKIKDNLLKPLLFHLFSDEENFLYFYYTVMLFFVLPMVCNIIFMIVSRKDDPRKLMLAALLVKLVHIPAYVMVFLFGVGAALMIFFTLPLILLLVIGDYVVLLISSSISVFAIAKNVKGNKMLSLIALFCQFFFCADVISLFVLWRASKKTKEAIF